MSKPWEDEVVKLWKFVTAGKRKFLSYRLLLIFVLIPALSGMTKSYSELISVTSSYFSSQKSVPSKAESDVFNEWVIAVGTAETEKKAKELRSSFKTVYLQSGHVNGNNEPIWINDIFYVRHPSEVGYWMVVIDALSGESTKDAVEKQLGILSQLAFKNRGSTNTFGHYLYGSRVIYYPKADFITSYGEIVGQ